MAPQPVRRRVGRSDVVAARSRWWALSALLATVTVACSSGAVGPTEPQAIGIVEQRRWGQVFQEEHVVGTFAVREVGSGRTLAWDAGRADERRSPASTFKIVNSMIILQTGVVADVDEPVRWDGVERDVEAWNRDHSLRSGIEVSAVWMYQELAREVGEDRMAAWVAAADYGNADIGGGIDEFWLRGDLRISPLEQLDFLERMVAGDLAFDPSVVADVRTIIVRERGNEWSWSYKTGTTPTTTSPLGWLVGTTERDGRQWVFAMNVDLESTEPGRPIAPRARQTVARRILEHIGALPPA